MLKSLTIILCFFHLAKVLSLPNQGCMILDLYYEEVSLFQQQAALWSLNSVLTGDQAVSTCADRVFFGGPIFESFNEYDGYTYMDRSYDLSLIPHQTIIFSLHLWFIDYWYGYDSEFYLLFGHENYWSYGFSALGSYQSDILGIFPDICGELPVYGNGADVPDVPYFFVFRHTEDLLSVKFQFWNYYYNRDKAKFGFRDIKILISNRTFNSVHFCGKTNPQGYLVYNNCGTSCSSGGTPSLTNMGCNSCHHSCEYCFGSADQDCLSCKPGYSYDGMYCVQCHSTCLSCSGSGEQDCVTCYEGDYLYPDGSCKKYCPNSNFVNGYSYCENPCPTSQYAYWNNTCINTCEFPLVANAFTGGYQECEFPCEDNEYLNYNGDCLIDCLSPWKIRTEGGRNFCDYPCDIDKFLYWNGSCFDSCPSPLQTFSDIGGTYCQYPCLISEYLHSNGSCESTCEPAINRVVEGGKNFCREYCPSGEFAYWNGSCLTTCDFPLNADYTSNLCNYPCTNPEYLYFNGSCKPSCISTLRSRTEAGENYCDYPCDDIDQYLFWNGSCLEECPSPLEVLEDSTTSRLFCHYQCDTEQYLYFNGSCESSCETTLQIRIEDGLNYCDYPCESNEYLYWNGSCETNCNFLTARINSGKNFCDFPCEENDQHLDWNNQCVNSCLEPKQQRSDTFGYSYCDPPCPVSSYYIYGIEPPCSISCDFPFIKLQNDTFLGCQRPCPSPDNPYFYWESELCKSTCNSPYVAVNMTGYINCTYQLSAEAVEQVQAVASLANGATAATGATAVASSLASPGDPGSISTAMLAKMLQYAKYMNISYPIRLQFMFESFNSTSGLASYTPEVPDKLKEDISLQDIPPKFIHFHLHSSFLINFWNTLMALVIFFVLWICFFVVDYLIIILQINILPHSIFRKIRFILQNLFITQLYSNLGDIVFFFVLDAQSSSLDSFATCLSLIISSLLFGITFIALYAHIALIRKYQRIKKARSKKRHKN